nr:MAG TPA: hypothetical protein [Caudoviricetes sp.]
MCTLTRIFVYSRYNAESGLINKKNSRRGRILFI